MCIWVGTHFFSFAPCARTIRHYLYVSFFLSFFFLSLQLRMKCGFACVFTAHCPLWMWTKEKIGDNSINTLRAQHMHFWFFDLSQPNEWRPEIIHLHQWSIHIDSFFSALSSFDILVCGSNIVSSSSAFIILITNMYEMALFVFISFVFDVSKTRKWQMMRQRRRRSASIHCFFLLYTIEINK